MHSFPHFQLARIQNEKNFTNHQQEFLTVLNRELSVKKKKSCVIINSYSIFLVLDELFHSTAFGQFTHQLLTTKKERKKKYVDLIDKRYLIE